MKDPIYQKFYKALLYKIETEYNGKMVECGNAAGIAKSYMSQICKGDRKPTFKKRMALVELFKMEYEEFLDFGDDLLNGRIKKNKPLPDDDVMRQIIPMLENLKNNDIVGFSEIVSMINSKIKKSIQKGNNPPGELKKKVS